MRKQRHGTQHFGASLEEIAHQRPFALLVDLAVDLLVQIAHRAGTDPRSHGECKVSP
jgi:hypothetical protein